MKILRWLGLSIGFLLSSVILLAGITLMAIFIYLFVWATLVNPGEGSVEMGLALMLFGLLDWIFFMWAPLILLQKISGRLHWEKINKALTPITG